MPDIITVTKFCPYCNGTLTHEHKNLLVCPRGHHIYISPRATNGVILTNEKNEILLVKRKSEPAKGLWDTPGGFIDLNENVEESLTRELKEELGITVTDFTYVGSKYDIYPYQGIPLPTLGLIFSAKFPKGQKICISSDVAGFHFFRTKDFPYDELSFERQKKFFREYLG